MKKYLFAISTAIIFSVSSSTVCNGQAALLVLLFGDKVATENFHVSIDGGLNISSLPGLAQGKPVYGFNFGLGTFIKLNDQWALTPEFKPLSSRGAKEVINILPNDISIQNPKTDFITNYIDIPLLVRYKISNSFFIAAGPQISFLTSAHQKTTGTTTSGQEVSVTQDMKSLMHKESFMVPVEIGYSLSRKRGGKDMDLKVRYNIGVMEAFTATSLAESKNATLQFILAFPFIK
jgi:hypothetical protein